MRMLCVCCSIGIMRYVSIRKELPIPESLPFSPGIFARGSKCSSSVWMNTSGMDGIMMDKQ